MSKRQPKNKKSEDKINSDIESDEDIDEDNKDHEDYTDPKIVEQLERADAKKSEDTEIDYADPDESDDDLDMDNIPEEVGVIEEDVSKSTIIEYIIPVDKRTTKDKITEYEYARLLMVRAKMISDGSMPLVNAEDLDNDEDIAKSELLHRKIPLLLKRIVGTSLDGKILIEIWDPKQMTLPANISSII